MKNYTSLEKMKASEVCPTYTEEKVTAETFPAEVAKGTLYRGFQPPKDATMLKFRYYSPDGTLMEQNNVPVVYDGTGISAITTFYLLTDKSDGITLESDGWTETVQTVTAEKRFLWTYIKTTYTNKTYSCTEPCISAVFGEQGERGAMYLGHYADNQAAYTDNEPAVFTGDYYLNTTDSYIHVYSKESNGWDIIEDLTDYRYNQSINDIFAAIENSTTKEEFIKAKKIWVQNMSAAIARVQMLLANEIKLTSGTDLDGKTTGGVIKSANYKTGVSGWQIDYNGNAEFSNGVFRGTFNGLYIGASEQTAYIDFKKQRTSSSITDQGSFSIGNNATSSRGSTVIGTLVKSTGWTSVIVGSQNTSTGDNNVLIGKNLTTEKSNMVVLGIDNETTKSMSVTIGNTITNQGQGAVAIGTQAKTLEYTDDDGNTYQAYGSIAIGNMAVAKGSGSICIGKTAQTNSWNTIAIGNGISADKYNILSIGCGRHSFKLFYFPKGTAHGVVWTQIHNTIGKYFAGESSYGGCIGNYRYEICKYGITDVSANGFDDIKFYNANNDSVLTVKYNSTDTLAYVLFIGLLPIVGD